MLGIGPFEIVIVLLVGLLMLYAAYRVGYRVGRAEGTLQGSERNKRAA